jgi:hypothetical protein
VAAGLPVLRGGQRDLCRIPTFGAPEPAWAEELWGWDAGRLLVGFSFDTLEIIPRDSFDDWLANWKWPAQLAPADRPGSVGRLAADGT